MEERKLSDRQGKFLVELEELPGLHSKHAPYYELPSGLTWQRTSFALTKRDERFIVPHSVSYGRIIGLKYLWRAGFKAHANDVGVFDEGSFVRGAIEDCEKAKIHIDLMSDEFKQLAKGKK